MTTANISEILNNKNLLFPYSFLTYLHNQLNYIIEAINNDLSNGLFIDDDTKSKITAYLTKLSGNANQQLGFLYYDDSTNIITVTFTYSINKEGSYNTLTLCSINVSNSITILNKILGQTNYDANIYDDLMTLQLLSDMYCSCATKITKLINIDESKNDSCGTSCSTSGLKGEKGDPGIGSTGDCTGGPCPAIDLFDSVGERGFTDTPITVGMDAIRIIDDDYTLLNDEVTILTENRYFIHYKITTDISENGVFENRNDFTIVRISTGLYEITFIDPHPNGDFYPVTATINDNPGADDYQIDIINNTSTSFFVRITEGDNGGTPGTPIDSNFSFVVSGNDSWAWGNIATDAVSATILAKGTDRYSPVSITNGYLEISTNNGVSWNKVNGSDIYIYNREKDFGKGTSTGTIIYDIVADTQFRLQVVRSQGDTAILKTVADSSSLSFTVCGTCKGDQGIQGIQGDTGDKGEPNGPKGEPGEKGEIGIISCDTADVYDSIGNKSFDSTPITVGLDAIRILDPSHSLSNDVVTVISGNRYSIHYKISTDVSNNNIFENRQNFTVINTSVGIYDITFTNPHPDGINYTVTGSLLNNLVNQDDYMIDFSIVSSTSFRAQITEQDNSTTPGVLINSDFSFIIPSNDAFAWGNINADASISGQGINRNSPVSISHGYLEISLNSGVSWDKVEGTDMFIYNREEDFGKGTASGTVMYNIVDGSQFRLRVFQSQGTISTLQTVPDGSSLSIVICGSADGATGDIGVQGIQGIQGDTGDTGLTGLKGDTGDIGIQGIQGIQGDTGDKGDKGEIGEKGGTGDIAQIEPGQVGQLSFNYTQPNGNGLETGGNSWNTISYLIYPGSDTAPFGAAVIIAYTTNVNTYYRYRLVDITNTQVITTTIASNTGTLGNPEVIDFQALVNLPATRSVITLEQGSTDAAGTIGGGNQSVGIQTLQLFS
jgi:hypothetical protein